MKGTRLTFILLFLLGAAIGASDVWRPAVDGSIRSPWRESDDAAIARNYYREGMNIFYPRIDWRGDGPGFTEMEFPVFPWTVAVLYKLFGYHEITGRLLSYFFSLCAFYVFFLCANHLLGRLAALGSSLFFVLNPLVFRISSSLQPEALLLLCYLLAVYTFFRWLELGTKGAYFGSMLFTAVAILVKVPAVHIGFLFLAVILSARGIRSLTDWRVWIFGIFSILPAALWYSHAYDLWYTYGNSLGLSNQYHWAGWDLFKDPSFIRGIGRLEIYYVWMPTGLILGVFGFLSNRSFRVAKYCSYWIVAVAVFYLVAARTTSGSWAYYYHIFSVPPAALLVGCGIEGLQKLRPTHRVVTTLILASSILFILVSFIISKGHFQIDSKSMAKVSAIVGLSVAGFMLLFFKGETQRGMTSGNAQRSIKNFIVYFLLACIPLTIFFETQVLVQERNPNSFQASYICAKGFQALIPQGTLILVSGGDRFDKSGYYGAYNASQMFYWTDRKGFNICTEDQSLEAIKSFARRGARYFVADKYAIGRKERFESELRKNFLVVGECDEAILFDLGNGK